jgi:hypothetical protein
MNFTLDEKNIDVEYLAKNAMKDMDLLEKIIKEVQSKKDTVRFNCHLILTYISINNPKILYPYWNEFNFLLKSNNNYHKFIAIHLLASLTKIDKEMKFEKIVDAYFNILKENRTMTAAHIAKKSGRIIKSKPLLEDKITNILLNIETYHKGKQIELIKASVISAFDEFYEISKNKEKIMAFVKKQLNSESPSTRKCSKEFLLKWST